MQLSQYVELAKRTESVPENLKINREQVAKLFEIYIHAGQLIDGLKRSIFYKNDDRFNADFDNHIASIIAIAGEFEDSIDNIVIFDEKKPADLFKSDEETSNIDVRMFHGVLGCTSESAELLEAFIGPVTDPTCPLDVVNVDEELGDHNWYEAILTDAGKLDWDVRQERNIAKLVKRYPEKYTDQDALNRDLTEERKVLEGNTTIPFNPGSITYHDREGNQITEEEFKKLCNPQEFAKLTAARANV